MSVAEKSVAGDRGDHGNGSGRIEAATQQVAHAASPTRCSRSRPGRILPLQLLIGMTEEIGRQVELRGHIGAGGWCDQSADVGDESRGPAINQLSNFGQAAVKPVEGHRGQRYQLVLRQGQRPAKGGVIVVPNVVERDQGVVGVVAAIKEDADKRLIAGSRSLSKGIQGAERPEPDKTAARGQRGVLDETAAVDTHVVNTPTGRSCKNWN